MVTRAKRIARELARSFVQTSHAGTAGAVRLDPVHRVAAIDVLERDIAHLVLHGGLHCMRLSLDQALAFPGGGNRSAGEPYLAIGSDCDGRVIYALRWVPQVSVDPIVQRRAVERFLAGELTKISGGPSLPGNRSQRCGPSGPSGG